MTRRSRTRCGRATDPSGRRGLSSLLRSGRLLNSSRRRGTGHRRIRGPASHRTPYDPHAEAREEARAPHARDGPRRTRGAEAHGRRRAQGRSQGPVGCPAASTGWRPRCQRCWHCGQCDIWRQTHSHCWRPSVVVYVHRQCSPCRRHASHRGTRVGIAVVIGIRALTWSDVWRGTPGSDGLAMRQGRSAGDLRDAGRR
jgi:hypothetical protein